MSSRYRNRSIVKNRNELYETLLEDKGVTQIRHFRTPKLKHFTSAERRQVRDVRVLWKQGDRFWKLASKYYGDPTYWWVIAWYNQKPTEASVEVGQVLLVPTPLNKVLELSGY